MTRICYLSVVTIACIFGSGSAQTTATPPEPDSGYVHLSYVLGKSSASIPFRQNRLVLTFSLDDPSTFNSVHSRYSYNDIPKWTRPVRSPKKALQAVTDALDKPEQPWESRMRDNHKCYLVQGFAYKDNDLGEFLAAYETAIKDFVVECKKIP